jgi:thioesterase domain-containing protein
MEEITHCPVAERNFSELVPLRKSGRTPPLFCVHDGNFQQMAAAMQVDQLVYGLRPVNLDTTDMNLTIEQLAANYLKQVCSVQEHGPYRFAGYSFGGLVAYEMATLLANSGKEVGLLALMDTGAQLKFRRKLPPDERKRIRKIYIADRTKKYARNLIEGRVDKIWLDASQYAGRLKPIGWKMAQRVSQILGYPLPGIMRSQSLMFTAMLRAYTPKEFRGRLVLFRPEERNPEDDVDPYLGWHQYPKHGIDVQFVPGSHATMMQMPNVATMARKLAPYLEHS